MEILRMPQNSEEWYEARMARVTASCISDVMAKGQGKVRSKYMLKLAAEKLTGVRQESYKNQAMVDGHIKEPMARAAYEFETDTVVEEIGVILKGEWVAASPDGLIGNNGILELKSPFTTTHIQYVMDDRLPPEYKQQVQGQLWISEREFCDFCSFDPLLSKKSLFIKRVYRDEEFIKQISIAVDEFIDELKSLMLAFL